MNEARYHQESMLLLLLTSAAMGLIGFAVMQMEYLEAPRGLVTLMSAAAGFGWVGGWLAERRGASSGIVSAAMATVTTGVTAGLCLTQGVVPASFWGLMLVLLLVMLASGMLRLKVVMD